MSTLGARILQDLTLPEGAHYCDTLSEDQIAQAATQVRALWGAEHSPASYLGHVHEQIHRSEGALHYAGVIDECGALIASHKRYQVDLASPAGDVSAMGIGAVFTPETHRGHGLAPSMLAEAMRRAKTRDVKLAILFSEIDARFYERLGFRVLPAHTFHASVADLPEDPDLELTPCDDFSLMLKLYDASFPDGSWYRKRTAGSFRYWAWRHGARARFLMAHRGEVVGYLSVALRAHALWVEDAVRVNTSRAVLWAALAQLARKAERAQVAGWLRPDDAGDPFVEQDRSLCVPMARGLGAADENLVHSLVESGVYFSALDSF
ncbi:MAG: GNAT family N-acetyltransferase [Polyangiaceae bacterium]